MKLLLENWRLYSKHLLLESQATNILDDLLSATHASGRPIPSQLAGAGNLGENESLQLANELASSLESNGIQQTLIDAGHHFYGPKSGRVLSDEEKKRLQDITAMIRGSVELFTGASVSTVRDPESFDPDRDIALNATHADVTAVKVDYEVANVILSAIAKGPYARSSGEVSKPIYRGMALPVAIARALKVGDVFGRDLSSWTKSQSQAIKFASGDMGAKKKDPNFLLGTLSVMFEIKKPKYGGQIENYSEYRNEEEVIRSRQVRITKITEPKGKIGILYECEEI
jgi:hypothetical protein